MGRGHQVQRTWNGKGSPGVRGRNGKGSPGVTEDREWEGVTRCRGQGMGRGHQV